MKLTVITKNLIKGLQSVERIVGKNLNLPILNTILFRTENGRLKLSSTNLEIGINYWIGGKVAEDGEICLPSKVVSDFISNITDEKIDLTSKNNILNISTDNYKTQIIGFNPKDFPIIPKIKGVANISVNSKVLKNTLVGVVDATSLSDSRPELSGVFCMFSENKGVFAATDSFRLAEKQIEITKGGQSASFILPRTTALEIIRVLYDLDEDINLIVSDNQIQFTGENFELISKLIDGRYPDYQKIVPNKYTSSVLFNKGDLEKSIRVSGIFSSNLNDIKIEVDNSKTKLMTKNTDRGELVSVIKSELLNSPFSISLNYNYLLDGLKNINSDKVFIGFTGDGGPLVLKPEDKKSSYTYLVMPLRN